MATLTRARHDAARNPPNFSIHEAAQSLKLPLTRRIVAKEFIGKPHRT